MTKRSFAFLFLVLALLANPSTALASACEAAAIVETKLGDVPALQDIMRRLSNDPEVSDSLKSILIEAFAGSDVEVTQLSPELRYKLSLKAEDNALSRRNLTKLRLVPRAASPSLNQQLSDRIELHDAKGHAVWVPDRPLDDANNDLLTFFHEVAHIRFAKFFENNLEYLASRFQHHISLAADGIFEVDELLWTYFDERYAVESEFLALKETFGRYYTQLPESWNPELLRLPEVNALALLSDYVCYSYEIRDPQIIDLRSHSLTKILGLRL